MSVAIEQRAGAVREEQKQTKKMNLIQLTFIVAVNMMGSGIIMLPTNMAKVGAISLLSWIVTALGSMAIAYGLAQAGLFNQRPGGMSAYADDAYGKSGFFMILRRTQPDLPRGFKVPFYPIAPILSVAFCLYLIFGLPAHTFLLFAVWLAVALIVYFTYSIRNSRLAPVRTRSGQAATQ